MSVQKKYKPLSKSFTPTVLDAISDLAEKGLSRQAIIRELGIDKLAFNRYKEPTDYFLIGRDRLAKSTAEKIIKSASNSFMDRKLLAEKLNLFSEPFTLKKSIKSTETAKEALSQSIELFCEGKITELQLQTISRACSVYVELESQTTLKNDVDEVKKLLKKRDLKR